MKSIKNIVFIGIFVIAIGAQIGYLLTYFKDDQILIKEQQEEINSIRLKIAKLEERVLLLPETEKQLELITAEKQAILETMPSFNSDSKELVELMRYISLNDYLKVEIKQAEESESTKIEDELGTIIERNYTISYESTYEDSKKFIENLNSAYQILNIKSMSMDNGVQALSEEQLKEYYEYFGNRIEQLVTTKLEFSIFVRENNTLEDEIYQPDFTIMNDANFIFMNRDTLETQKKTNDEAIETSTEPVQPANNQKMDVFSLNIGDMLLSGDTYKLSGPSKNGEGYVGLVASTDVHINITVNQDGYELSIEDKEGNVKQKNINMSIYYPKLNIVSTMRQIQDVMPNVHVYVLNYTGQVMEVNLSGSLLENIHIYNEYDEPVSKGQTKGSIKLI